MIPENQVSQAQKEFDLAWQEYFKDKPRPKTDKEEKKQLENFTNWYNNVRKQSDTGKTPAEMYKETYGKEPKDAVTNNSRMLNFEWDENYDEELFGLIEELKEYDNPKGYELEYEEVKKKLEPTIKKITEKGKKALDMLHELLEHEETWSCFFALEILKEIKSEKSVPYAIDFIISNEDTDYTDGCDVAMDVLINIGAPAVDEIISAVEEGLKEKIHYCCLCEALSKIKNKKGSELRLKVLKDYLSNPKKYRRWFNLVLFICDFNEDDKEALPLLKQLSTTDLTEEESRELDGAIELIEDPE